MTALLPKQVTKYLASDVVARRRVEAAVATLLLAYPIVLLSVRSGVSSCFTALLVLACFYLFTMRQTPIAELFDARAMAYAAAVSSMLLATALSALVHNRFTLSILDGPSRLMLAVPIYLMLRDMPWRMLTIVQYGFPAGAIAAAGFVLLYPPNWTAARAGTYFANVIHFGDLALMLGLLSVLSLHWSRKDSTAIVAFKVFGLAAGIFASVASGSRGGWVAIPACFVIWLASMQRTLSRPVRFAAVIAFIAVVAAVVFSPVGRDRMGQFYSDLVRLEVDMDTSLGLRLQLWKVSLLLFLQHPLAGIGSERFADFLPQMHEAGIITRDAVEIGMAEIHNEIMMRSAALGLPGLAAILAIHLVPAVLFARYVSSAEVHRRRAAVMGLCLVTSFFLFGMTVEIYNLKMTVTFYSLTLALLLAVATTKTTERA